MDQTEAERESRPRVGWSVALKVGAVAIGLGLLFMAARVATYDGDVTALIRAGDLFTDADRSPDLHVLDDSAGYDGQFFYRLAREPFSLEPTLDGVHFDRPAYRNARLGYPVAAWLLSGGGRQAAVPWALAGVNLLAVGAIGGLGARLAQKVGRSPWIGLLFAAWPGLIVGMAYDLAEPLEAALLLAALLLLRDQRDLPAALVLAYAAITRETALLVPLACLGLALVHPWRHRLPRWFPTSDRRPGWIVGVLPVSSYVAIQVAMTSRWDSAAGGGAVDSAKTLSVPFLALVRQIADWLRGPELVDLYQLLQVVLIAGIVVMLGSAAATATGRPWERWAFLGALLAVVSLGAWSRGVIFLRYPDDLVMIGLVLHVSAPSEQLPDWARTPTLAKAMAVLSGLTALIWVTI